MKTDATAEHVNISWSHEGKFLRFLYFSDCGAEKKIL